MHYQVWLIVTNVAVCHKKQQFSSVVLIQALVTMINHLTSLTHWCLTECKSA